jgi:hypothetical protein
MSHLFCKKISFHHDIRKLFLARQQPKVGFKANLRTCWESWLESDSRFLFKYSILFALPQKSLKESIHPGSIPGILPALSVCQFPSLFIHWRSLHISHFTSFTSLHLKERRKGKFWSHLHLHVTQIVCKALVVPAPGRTSPRSRLRSPFFQVCSTLSVHFTL